MKTDTVRVIHQEVGAVTRCPVVSSLVAATRSFFQFVSFDSKSSQQCIPSDRLGCSIGNWRGFESKSLRHSKARWHDRKRPYCYRSVGQRTDRLWISRLLCHEFGPRSVTIRSCMATGSIPETVIVPVLRSQRTLIPHSLRIIVQLSFIFLSIYYTSSI